MKCGQLCRLQEHIPYRRLVRWLARPCKEVLDSLFARHLDLTGDIVRDYRVRLYLPSVFLQHAVSSFSNLYFVQGVGTVLREAPQRDVSAEQNMRRLLHELHGPEEAR